MRLGWSPRLLTDWAPCFSLCTLGSFYRPTVTFNLMEDKRPHIKQQVSPERRNK